MSTITSKVYVTAWRFSHMRPGEVHWSICDSKIGKGAENCIGQWEHEITLPMPSDFNAVAAEVQALEAAKAKALDEYHASVRAINDRLSKLQAIECDEVAA